MLLPKSFFVIGNWKMNPATRGEARDLAKRYVSESRGVQMVMCPPAIFFDEARTSAARGIALGVQDVDSEPQTSSMTGSLSAFQAASAGAMYAIVGHSSRRARGETNEDVNLKTRACLEADIIPVVCIGEKSRDTSGGYIEELKEQVRSSFASLEKQDFEHIIVAYEPLWAIGAEAKREATPSEAQEVRILVEKTIDDMTGNVPLGSITVIYGGSVSTPEEIAQYAKVGMKGVLIGRASLDADTFNALGNISL